MPRKTSRTTHQRIVNNPADGNCLFYAFGIGLLPTLKAELEAFQSALPTGDNEGSDSGSDQGARDAKTESDAQPLPEATIHALLGAPKDSPPASTPRLNTLLPHFRKESKTQEKSKFLKWLWTVDVGGEPISGQHIFTRSKELLHLNEALRHALVKYQLKECARLPTVKHREFDDAAEEAAAYAAILQKPNFFREHYWLSQCHQTGNWRLVACRRNGEIITLQRNADDGWWDYTTTGEENSGPYSWSADPQEKNLWYEVGTSDNEDSLVEVITQKDKLDPIPDVVRDLVPLLEEQLTPGASAAASAAAHTPGVDALSAVLRNHFGDNPTQGNNPHFVEARAVFQIYRQFQKSGNPIPHNSATDNDLYRHEAVRSAASALAERVLRYQDRYQELFNKPEIKAAVGKKLKDDERRAFRHEWELYVQKRDPYFNRLIFEALFTEHGLPETGTLSDTLGVFHEDSPVGKAIKFKLKSAPPDRRPEQSRNYWGTETDALTLAQGLDVNLRIARRPTGMLDPSKPTVYLQHVQGNHWVTEITMPGPGPKKLRSRRPRPPAAPFGFGPAGPYPGASAHPPPSPFVPYGYGSDVGNHPSSLFPWGPPGGDTAPTPGAAPPLGPAAGTHSDGQSKRKKRVTAKKPPLPVKVRTGLQNLQFYLVAKERVIRETDRENGNSYEMTSLGFTNNQKKRAATALKQAVNARTPSVFFGDSVNTVHKTHLKALRQGRLGKIAKPLLAYLKEQHEAPLKAAKQAERDARQAERKTASTGWFRSRPVDLPGAAATEIAATEADAHTPAPKTPTGTTPLP